MPNDKNLMSKEPKLKPQHRIVVEEIAKGKSQTDAYLVAYPNVKSRKVAQVNATRLLSNAIISQAVQNRIRHALHNAKVTPEEVVGGAVRQMRSSLDDVLNEAGSYDIGRARETGAIDFVKKHRETIRRSTDRDGNTEEIKTVEVEMLTNQDARKEVAGLMRLGYHNNPQTPEQRAANLFRALVTSHNFTPEEAFEGIEIKLNVRREQIEPFIDIELLGEGEDI